MKNHVVNLVNFIRGCDPRKKDWDLYSPVAGQIKINKKNRLSSTFLLQYDAMLRKDIIELIQKEKDGSMELGVWFEMVRPLTEACGIEWRGREGYDWDWYVNPGFLMAYTQEERQRLIDEIFKLFKNIFGEYPRVVGSWLLDAYSMKYMSEKYEIDAFAICREQYAVDAYTLWGGYYSGGYYPSKNNMLCPAQHKDLQINTPVFRMLGIDPIYGYDEGKHSPSLGGCYTMEPVWPCGADEGIMDWYFHEYFKNPTLSQGHATTGQENSFGWARIEKGYDIQAKLLKKYIASGDIKVEMLGETGRAFKKSFESTPSSALSALQDWSNNGLQSVWYSSKFYRANLFYKDGNIYFRDIHVFDDRINEEYLISPCKEWSASYETLPIVENRLWSDENKESVLRLCEAVEGIIDLKELDGNLEACVKFADGHIGKVCFYENSISFHNCSDLVLSFGNQNILSNIKGDTLDFCYKGIAYSICFTGKLMEIDHKIRISPVNDEIICRIT